MTGLAAALVSSVAAKMPLEADRAEFILSGQRIGKG
jgi:hypothetical protein